jgi:predicted RNA binding protein YcfA (HicA-like mRNA interferase family)
MKLPRDVNGIDAARVLRRLGFEVQRQTGPSF